MVATLELRGETLIVNTPQSVTEAMHLLKLEHDSYIFIRNGELIDPEENLHEGDIVQLIPVIAGG